MRGGQCPPLIPYIFFWSGFPLVATIETGDDGAVGAEGTGEKAAADVAGEKGANGGLAEAEALFIGGERGGAALGAAGYALLLLFPNGRLQLRVLPLNRVLGVFPEVLKFEAFWQDVRLRHGLSVDIRDGF